MTLSLTEIEQRLAATRVSERPFEGPAGTHAAEATRRCAVAILLREGRDAGSRGAEILFIRRAEKHDDPWSGHMAFPGGHIDAEDPSPLAAAIRETREEIGVHLPDAGRHIATLEPQQPAMRDGGGLMVAPFVFTLTQPVECATNHEVAEVVWTPLAPLMRAENHVGAIRRVNAEDRAFSGYRVKEEHLVWGLTYRMLHSLFLVLDPHWRAPRG